MALLDYLAERRAQIETQLKALKAELGEIRIAEAALTGAPVAKTALTTHDRGSTAIRHGSIKDWALRVLMLADSGLETDGVIDAIKHHGGPDVPRNSITPQLSRLKSAGLLNQEGRLWTLASPGSLNDEASGGDTPDAPAEGDASDDEFPF